MAAGPSDGAKDHSSDDHGKGMRPSDDKGRNATDHAPAAPGPGECPAQNAATCAAVWQKIGDLEAQRDQAINANDETQVSQTMLEINHQTDVLKLLKAGTSDAKAYSDLDAKYARLRDILAKQGKVAYDPREVKAVEAVFKDYGELYIAESAQLTAGSSAGDHQEVQVAQPWAGYWYPFRGDDLFRGEDAPLAKLDRVLATRGMPALTALQEEKSAYNPTADSWEGRCAPWSIAAITSREPHGPVSLDGTTFSISDQKALLTLAHERYPVKVYGIRYDGDATTDGTFQSMRPEAFHQVFVTLLAQQHRAFVLNDDSGSEVWSRPVYRVRWSVKKDPAMANAFLVDASVFTIFNREKVSNDPTDADADRHALEYQYRLYVDPTQVVQGKAKVIAGEWLNDSFVKHPHYVTIPAAQGELASNNAELNKVMAVVHEIVDAKPALHPAP